MVNYHKELPLDDAKRMVKKIFQQCIKSGSVMGIDMSVAAWTDISYMEKLYPYILEMIGTADTWITSPGKIAEWWQKRAAVTVDESLYEVSVSFADDMESFTLQLIGDVRIKEILDGNQPELKYEITAQPNATVGEHLLNVRLQMNFNGQPLILELPLKLTVIEVKK